MFCLLCLVIIGIINIAQLNALEEGMISNRKAIAELSEKVSEGGVPVAQAVATTAAAVSEEEQALQDPNNLLKRAETGLPGGVRPVVGGTFRGIIGSDPPSLNYYSSNAADVSEITKYTTEFLADRRFDNPSVFTPALAIKVTTPDDGLTYEIQLRKGVYWHTPQVDWESGSYDWLKGDHELTTDDFKFAFEMLENPQVSGRMAVLRNYFESLAGVDIIDRYRFRVRFKERLFMNLPILLDGLAPVPRWLFMYDEAGQKFDDANWGLKYNEHWYHQKVLGVGPYKLEKWEPGVRLEFTRNKRYYGKRPTFDKLSFAIIKDQNAWPRKLKTGEIDITKIQPEQYRTEVLNKKGKLLGTDKIKFKEQPTLGYFYLGWNADRPFFRQKEVRQAMTMAFNREEMIKSVFSGLGKLTTGPFAQQSECYDKNVKPWPFDLQKAAAKLEEAGWKDTDGDGIRDKVIDGTKIQFSFNLLVYGSSNEYTTLANIYREDLLQIGVKLNPQAVEWSTMLKKMNGREFDAYTGAWVLGWETDLVQLWHSKEADKTKSSNRIGFRNKDADRIADTLRRTYDSNERTKLCHEFHQLVHDEQPYTFFYQRSRPVLYWDHMNEPEFAKIYPYRNKLKMSFREARP